MSDLAIIGLFFLASLIANGLLLWWLYGQR